MTHPHFSWGLVCSSGLKCQGMFLGPCFYPLSVVKGPMLLQDLGSQAELLTWGTERVPEPTSSWIWFGQSSQQLPRGVTAKRRQAEGPCNLGSVVLVTLGHPAGTGDLAQGVLAPLAMAQYPKS